MPLPQGVSPPPHADSGYGAPTLDDPLRKDVGPVRRGAHQYEAGNGVPNAPPSRMSLGGGERYGASDNTGRMRVLESKVIDLTLELESAKEALQAEKAKGLVALARQADELRKDREASESRLVASIMEGGKQADAARAKMMEVAAANKRLEKEMARLSKERDDLQSAFLENQRGASAEAAQQHRLELTKLRDDEVGYHISPALLIS